MYGNEMPINMAVFVTYQILVVVMLKLALSAAVRMYKCSLHCVKSDV